MSSRPTFASSLTWSYVADGGRQAVTSAISLVLAALLGPEVFGLVAMGLVYIAFIELLLKQGMAAAVIQRRDLSPKHLDSAFWLVVGSAVFLSVVSVLLSGWWATVNRTPQLRPVLLGLTVMIPLQGLTVIQEALLRRELRFKALALRTNMPALLGGVLGIVLAFRGFGVWALVAQQVSTSLVAVVVLWAVSGWRPRFRFDGHAARQLLSFSSGSFVSSLGVFVNNRSDALLIGLLFGPVIVGLYRLASRLVDMVIGITVRALQSLALPELSRVQDDPPAFKQRLLRLLAVSSLLSVPTLGVLAGSSEAALGLIGDEWQPAAGALRLLCVAGAVRGVFVVVGPMLQALGHPHKQAVLSWLLGALSAGGFVVAGLLVRGQPGDVQLTGLASAPALLYGGIFAGICVWLVNRFSGVAPDELLRATAPAVAGGTLASVVASGAHRLLGGLFRSQWATLATAVVPAILAAVVLVFAMDPRLRSFAGKMGRAVAAGAVAVSSRRHERPGGP